MQKHAGAALHLPMLTAVVCVCRVRDVMTSLEQVFMLERSLHLTFQTMLAIYKSGVRHALQ